MSRRRRRREHRGGPNPVAPAAPSIEAPHAPEPEAHAALPAEPLPHIDEPPAVAVEPPAVVAEPPAAVAEPAPVAAEAPAPAAEPPPVVPEPLPVAAEPRPIAPEPPAAPVRPLPEPPRPRPLATARMRPGSRRPAPTPEPSPNRTVVKVTMAQAAAAGNQVLRSAPPVPDSMRRPSALSPRALSARPGPERAAPAPTVEAAPAPPAPLPAPRADARLFHAQHLSSPGSASRIEKALGAVAGVVEAEASLATGLVAVSPATVDPAAIQAALAAAGHPSPAIAPGAAGAAAESRRLALFGLATAAAGIAAFALRSLSPAAATVLGLASLAGAVPIAPAALRQLLRGRSTAEELPLLSAALLAGAGLLRGGPVELCAAPIAAYLLIASAAAWLRSKLLAQVELVRAALPAAAEGLKSLELAAGDAIPADGRLLAAATLDESPLGGSDAIDRAPGERVLAGTRARTAVSMERVSGPGRLERGLALAERALASRPPRALEIAARVIVPVAALAAIAAGILHGPGAAAAVLAGAAPLALAVAGALAPAAGIARALSRGAAARSPAALLRAGATRTLLLDKGAVLLREDASVTEMMARPGADPLEILPLAAGAETGVDHPVARALRTHCADLHLVPAPVAERRERAGLGVEATVAGKRVVVGSTALASGLGMAMGHMAGAALEVARRGRTPVLVAIDGEVAFVAGVGQTPHDAARRAFGSLENMGVQIGLLSSDASATGRWLAEVCGLDPEAAVGELSLEGKVAAVTAARRTGTCTAVFGAESDLPALRAADLPVVVDPALAEEAGALLIRPEPDAAAELVRAGRASRAALLASSAFGIAGTAAAMALATAGLAGPLTASILGLLTSVLALGIAGAPLLPGQGPTR